jgi:antitoxin MazE
MRGKVSRWGNSLAIRIPKSLVDEVGFGEDDQIEIRVESSKLVVARATTREEFTLDELLDQIPEGLQDEEVDWGPPVGREVW